MWKFYSFHCESCLYATAWAWTCYIHVAFLQSLRQSSFHIIWELSSHHNLSDQDPNVKNHFWYAVTLLTIACKSTGHIYTIYCHAKIHCFPPQSWNNWVCIRSHWQNTKEVYNIPFDSAFISLQYSSVWCCLKLQYSVQNIHIQSTYNVFLMRASVTSLWWWQMTSWP